MSRSAFVNRHIGPNQQEIDDMLAYVKASSVNELIQQTIPQSIQAETELVLPEALTEFEMLELSRELAEKNSKTKCYIGMGYHPTLLPPVIQRNILENPGWYTAYTPYQAEISQGRLEALLNFQTLVSDVTGLPIANASLLDEGTAAAEAMHMFYETRTRDQIKNNVHSIFVSAGMLPQTLAVLQTKAEGLGIDLIVEDTEKINWDIPYFGAIYPYTQADGKLNNPQEFISKASSLGIRTAMSCDILSLCVLTSPGELGADIAFGTSQRFGIPMGYGGPHAAFFACKEDYKRNIPGRIIGVSEDRHGNRALRMALQTREQHIKRERATSNICTAQVLLAVMSGFYAVYHGKEGLIEIAQKIHQLTGKLKIGLEKLGYSITHDSFFDTICISTPQQDKEKIRQYFQAQHILFNYHLDNCITISFDETTSEKNVEELLDYFATLSSKEKPETPLPQSSCIPSNLVRTSDFLTHEVFSSYRTETELMRYIKRLENKDLSLTHSMISLGSCTMKLNAAVELIPLSWPNWNSIHPFSPKAFVGGYQNMIHELETYLSEITGFAATSLQPNSGAQGEYAGLMVIRAYQKAQGETHRNIVLIPQSAHGTNPASAVLSGMKVVVVKNLENGEFDLEDLTQKASEHKDTLSALMITYPSTYGFFDDHVKMVTSIIHENGGQVYMDGANMNAQVGLTNPALIGADVCHLNLHKTFSIPHGGGGPGVGPICVAEHLQPFLPQNPIIKTGGAQGIDAISSAPYGSSLILNISYAYIRLLGSKGVQKASEIAILNANYLKEKLSEHYPILYANAKGRVAHECIIDCRQFKPLQIEVTDIAKRLMDYGFHAPTVSFPVAGTLMVEPTESESKKEIDRFIDVMISIKKEIDEIANGDYSQEENVLKNAPHTLEEITSDEWKHTYTRQKAAFPMEGIVENKFWPSVGRINEAQGDRNLICTCNPIENYQ